ncbi:MAG: segregation/condensation protein A [Oscillospiraceae bacterium]|jgi:segregation and condensation protein A|nr:segregation/condensation protein A [Oscillospiraceae bacterium]
MAYTVYLKAFEGPLDLVLHLISRAKVDIRDVFVSEITEQYLASMEDIASLDMDAASEFLAMAATLLEIKSRALLPKPPKVEEGEETPEEALIRRLAEYAALREGVDQMQQFEKAAARMFEKLPEEIPLPPPVFELKNLTMDGLMAAMRRVLLRMVDKPPEAAPAREIPRYRLSVQACMFAIAARVREAPCRFDDLFSEQPTKEEIVTLFMAILELLRLGRLHVKQTDTFGEIILSDGKGGDADGQA